MTSDLTPILEFNLCLLSPLSYTVGFSPHLICGCLLGCVTWHFWRCNSSSLVISVNICFSALLNLPFSSSRQSSRVCEGVISHHHVYICGSNSSSIKLFLKGQVLCVSVFDWRVCGFVSVFFWPQPVILYSSCSWFSYTKPVGGLGPPSVISLATRN